MDVMMLDVTDVPDVAIGDVATVYGSDGAQRYPANVVARSIGTVTSDLISGVSRRVPRFYLPDSRRHVQTTISFFRLTSQPKPGVYSSPR